MAVRSVRVVLSAAVGDFVRGTRQASRAARDLGRDTMRAAQRNREAFNTAGTAAVAFGTLASAGLLASARAAIQWESAFAGVKKVVEGTPEEIAQLEGELRELARTLPVAHEEIAATAAAAGQLGIARENITSFTTTMLQLGVATNLSADEAATALARFSNIMGTSADDVDRLGATIVDLGNNSATTEAEIVEFAMRVAGAGATVGLAESDVLGIAAAMSSLGINAEAGGTAISRVLVRLSNDIALGSEDVQKFADIAGMSAQAFAAAFEEDAAGATLAFIEGLSAMEASGESALVVLNDLGLSDIRVRDALLRMANGGDLARNSIDLASTAWERNLALVKEANARYDTTESKISSAMGSIRDAAIEFGSVLLPIIADGADKVGSFANSLGALPDPLQEATMGLGAVAGATGLGAGAFLLMAPRVADTYDAMRKLNTTMPRLSANLKALGVAAAVAASIYVLSKALNGIGTSGEEAADGMAAVTESLVGLENAKPLDELFNFDATWWDDLTQADHDINNVAEALARIERSNANGGLDKVGDFFSRTFQGGADDLAYATKQFETIDAVLANMVDTGNAEMAAKSVAELRAQIDASASSTERAAELHAVLDGVLVQYGESVEREKANQAELAAVTYELNEANEVVKSSTEGVAAAMRMTEEEVEELKKRIEELAENYAAFVEPMGAYNDLLDRKAAKEREAAEATAEATKSSKDSWEDYYDGVSVSVSEWIAELEKQVKAQEEWEENMLLLASRVSENTLEELARLGPEGAPLVADLVDASDKELDRLEDVFVARMEAATQAQARTLIESHPILTAIARKNGQDVADDVAKELAAGTTTVEKIMKEYGVAIDGAIEPPRATPISVEGLGPAKREIRSFQQVIDDLKGKTINVGVNFNDGGSSASPNPFKWTARKDGGYTPPGMTLVGEEGPELVNFDRPGMVYTAAQTRALMELTARGGVGPIMLDPIRVRTAAHGTDDAATAARQFTSRTVGAIERGVRAAYAAMVRPTTGYRVSSEFGMRRHPVTGTYKLHDGIDLAAPSGTPVVAARAGRVAYTSSAGGYGRHLAVSHAGGLRTLYAHLSSILARAGQVVSAGQLIGRVGSTGYSTGPHLHFRVDRNGVPVNPRRFFSFDQGGLARGRGGLWKDTIRPERVLSPRQTDDFGRLVRMLEAGQMVGAGPRHAAPAAAAPAPVRMPDTLVVVDQDGALVGRMRVEAAHVTDARLGEVASSVYYGRRGV